MLQPVVYAANNACFPEADPGVGREMALRPLQMQSDMIAACHVWSLRVSDCVSMC